MFPVLKGVCKRAPPEADQVCELIASAVVYTSPPPAPTTKCSARVSRWR